MKKTGRILTIALLIGLFFICSAQTCSADTVPYYADYVSCEVHINGVTINQPATLIKGNIYIDIDTLQKYGRTEGWNFNTPDRKLYIDAEDLSVKFADEETTNFILGNAGTVEFVLKYFNTDYDTKYRYYISLGSIAGLAGMEYSYKDGVVFITTHTEGDGFIYTINKKDKIEYDEPISAMWCDLNECPDKITGIDVFADISLFPWVDSSGENYVACQNSTDYGIIQSAKNNGYNWWICAMNFHSSNTATYNYIDSTLKDMDSARAVAAKYLFYTAIFNADGINIDYESMSASDRTYFIYFCQTLCRYADKLGLTTSVCTYAGTNYSNNTVYPFEILGQCFDFICEMAYEPSYNPSSSYSISVQTKDYYTERTDFIADRVAHNKILMGFATYTFYVWYDNGSYAGYVAESMNGIWEEPENMTTVWEEITGQYLATQPYTRSGYLYEAKFYLEEERSVALKAQYVVDNGLGGTIGWTYSYSSIYYEQNKKMYEALDAIYHKGKTYQDFVPPDPIEESKQEEGEESEPSSEN